MILVSLRSLALEVRTAACMFDLEVSNWESGFNTAKTVLLVERLKD